MVSNNAIPNTSNKNNAVGDHKAQWTTYGPSRYTPQSHAWTSLQYETYRSLGPSSSRTCQSRCEALEQGRGFPTVHGQPWCSRGWTQAQQLKSIYYVGS
jgi:hypothetical protein